MHRTDHARWAHDHNFARDSSVAERRTRRVVAIAAVMMLIEIIAGMVFNSMALLADGWHMSTHVAAFLITVLAYYFTRRHAADALYSFGTGKMGVLGGFASAIILSVIALFMAGESVHRVFIPMPIHFNEAIIVAVVGLAVNLVCALLLRDDHHHQHHDLNLRAAYIHVLADALTSVTAIIALVSGKFFGWSWLDPVMGIVGSVIVATWAYGLLRDTGGILLDRTPASSDLPEEIRRAVESDGDATVADLHIWQLSAGKFAAIISIVAHDPKSADEYRHLIQEHEELIHVTVEIQRCCEHEAQRPTA